ncbi:glycosyltransferase family 2 protein [Methylobacterium nodulans]|uniref:Glycosyl transferase family 2 n=1 Tax=Methylobacterium nodulans (strain LMG 21967 / CNCM I-2342 / ORS 2060) TaxID=460265 RepID=B8IDZ4_METNO|nr:glycosyltransferase family 2 protein [Methylobacterium nodulans]ACL57540.1 glycosyl transferase family 2 [Methylobacterium nodulans ORS 2060]
MIGSSTKPHLYSFVIPVYNEEAVLPLLFSRLDALLPCLDGPAEVILVDDGSRDATGIIAVDRAKNDPRYRYMALSRNFGHQVAITAGMEAAVGDAVIIMDADLQDPPEVALELVAKWRAGYDIVYAQRMTRIGESRFKLATAKAFYKLLTRLTAVNIPENVGDFRLIDRKVLEAFRAMPERDRFVRGMFGWMGFRQTAVPFHRPPRAAGTTKYGWWKMLRLAFDAIVGFSDIPLRLALWIGTAVSFGALLYGIYVLWLAMHNADLVAGWASTIVILSFLSGIHLVLTGVVGLYIGRIHAEVKARPLYFVARSIGFDAELPIYTGRHYNILHSSNYALIRNSDATKSCSDATASVVQ